MPVNWPPPTAPSWPPPELGTHFECSDLRVLIATLLAEGFTQSAPTVAERNAFFPNTVRCDDNHQVTGRMIISPSNVRYPFCVCNNGAHRELLVLWPPYAMGWDTGKETA